MDSHVKGFSGRFVLEIKTTAPHPSSNFQHSVQNRVRSVASIRQNEIQRKLIWELPIIMSMIIISKAWSGPVKW